MTGKAFRLNDNAVFGIISVEIELAFEDEEEYMNTI